MADRQALFPVTSADASANGQLAALQRDVRKHGVVIAFGCVAGIGMTAWVYFLGWAVLQAVEWTLG